MRESTQTSYLKKVVPLIIILSLLFAGRSWSFPIITEQAVTVPKHQIGWRARTLLVRRSSGDNDLTAIVPSLSGAFGITSDFEVGASIPYFYANLDGLESSGISDIRLFSFYRFYRKDKPFSSKQLSLFASVKLPTGEVTERGEDGERLAPPLQPGTGSFDYIAGPIFTHRVNIRFAYHANLFYRLNTEGSQDFEFGDQLIYNLAAEYRAILRPETSIVLELNGIYSRRNKINNTEIADSGGNIIFLTAGLQGLLPYTKRIIWEVTTQIPVIEDTNGEQLDNDFNILTGLRYLF